MSRALAPTAPAGLSVSGAPCALGQKVSDVAGQVVYSTCYCLAYTATLPLALVFYYTPKSNWFVRGVLAGSGRAFRVVDGVPTTAKKPTRAKR